MQLGDARKLDQRHRKLCVFAPFFLLRRARRTWSALAVGFIADGQPLCGAFRRNGTSGIEKGKRGRRAAISLF